MSINFCNSRPHINPTIDPVILKKDLQPYVHGGGYGIATEILANPYFADVLKALEPSLYQSCDTILNKHRRVLNASSAKSITLAMENSPVVAALARFKLGLVPLEWDIWLDPDDPSSVNKAVILHGSVFAFVFGKFSSTRNYFLKSAPSVTRWVEVYNEAICKFNHLSKDNIQGIPSICLDIKSPWSTAKDVNLFVQALNVNLNINVSYVGSFSFRQIEEVSGPKRILFTHALWDLKKKVASGSFPRSLMLNGADLQEDSDLGALLQIQKKCDVEFGLYIQEPEAGTDAVQRLIKLVNDNPKLFSLGFALGNRRDGRSARMIKGSGAGVQKPLLTRTLLKIKRIASFSLAALGVYCFRRYIQFS